MSLTHKDVQDILRLLDDSPYNDLHLETESFTLHLKRTEDGKGWTQETKTAASRQPPAASLASTQQAKTDSEPAPTEAGLLDVRAPIVGTFYRAPKPGAEPFVETGSTVDTNSVVGIIEVMKLMNSVPARVSGEIVEIHAADAGFVEKGQLLMRVRPPGKK